MLGILSGASLIVLGLAYRCGNSDYARVESLDIDIPPKNGVVPQITGNLADRSPQDPAN